MVGVGVGQHRARVTRRRTQGRASTKFARQGDAMARVILALVVAATLATSGAFLDRTATERLLSFRPWGFLGLLLVVVEFSAPRTRSPVRTGTAPG